MKYLLLLLTTLLACSTNEEYQREQAARQKAARPYQIDEDELQRPFTEYYKHEAVVDSLLNALDVLRRQDLPDSVYDPLKKEHYRLIAIEMDQMGYWVESAESNLRDSKEKQNQPRRGTAAKWPFSRSFRVYNQPAK